MATCNTCRWKVERNECPWDWQYSDTDYAEDCIDYRATYFDSDAFKPGTFDEDIEKEQKNGEQ